MEMRENILFASLGARKYTCQEITSKFLQIISTASLKKPSTAVVVGEPFLPSEGSKISLRFLVFDKKK